MKHLILMNPVRRRRKSGARRRRLYGAALKAHQRRVGGGRRRRRSSTVARRVTRRRVRRNPVVRARKSRGHSAAMRAKISRAVKAANRRRQGGVVRRSFTSVSRRFSRRSGGGGGGGFNLSNPFKQLFSKSTLTVAGGAVASSFITQFVLTRFGASLPLASQPVGRIAYKLLIPVAGAMVTKRFNRDLASGMLIGGAVMAINELIAMWGPKVAGAPVAGLRDYGQEYDGEADFATGTYMGDIGAGGMPSALSDDGDGSLSEYFEGDDQDPFTSAPAFRSEF